MRSWVPTSTSPFFCPRCASCVATAVFCNRRSGASLLPQPFLSPSAHAEATVADYVPPAAGRTCNCHPFGLSQWLHIKKTLEQNTLHLCAGNPLMRCPCPLQSPFSVVAATVQPTRVHVRRTTTSTRTVPLGLNTSNDAKTTKACGFHTRHCSCIWRTHLDAMKTNDQHTHHSTGRRGQRQNRCDPCGRASYIHGQRGHNVRQRGNPRNDCKLVLQALAGASKNHLSLRSDEDHQQIKRYVHVDCYGYCQSIEFNMSSSKRWLDQVKNTCLGARTRAPADNTPRPSSTAAPHARAIPPTRKNNCNRRGPGVYPTPTIQGEQGTCLQCPAGPRTRRFPRISSRDHANRL